MRIAQKRTHNGKGLKCFTPTFSSSSSFLTLLPLVGTPFNDTLLIKQLELNQNLQAGIKPQTSLMKRKLIIKEVA